MQTNFRNAILFLICASFTTTAIASEDVDSLKEEIKKIKDQRSSDRATIDELKSEIEKIKATSSTGSTTALSPKDKKQIRKNKNLIEEMKDAIDDEQRLSLSGFLSAGVVKGEGDYFYGTTDKKVDFSEGYNFRSDSVMGLQVDYDLPGNFKSTIQLVSTGANDFEVKTEWAYLDYLLSDNLTFRAGRLRIPFYYYSETLEVGMTYPFARPPVDVYINELTSFEGVDVLYTFYTGDWIHRAKLIWGGTSSKVFDIDNLYGLSLSSEIGNWLFRESYIQSDISTVVGDANVKYYSGSIRYSDGVWFSIAEWAKLDTNKGPLFTQDAGYITVGRNWNKWGAFLSYSTRYTTEKNNDPLASIQLTTSSTLGGLGAPTPHESNDSVTLDLRYNFTYKTSVKFEVQHMFDFKEDANGIVSDGVVIGIDSQPKSESDDIIIYSIVFDLIF